MKKEAVLESLNPVVEVGKMVKMMKADLENHFKDHVEKYYKNTTDDRLSDYSITINYRDNYQMEICLLKDHVAVVRSCMSPISIQQYLQMKSNSIKYRSGVPCGYTCCVLDGVPCESCGRILAHGTVYSTMSGIDRIAFPEEETIMLKPCVGDISL